MLYYIYLKLQYLAIDFNEIGHEDTSNLEEEHRQFFTAINDIQVSGTAGKNLLYRNISKFNVKVSYNRLQQILYCTVHLTDS